MIPVKEFFAAGRATFTLELPEDFQNQHDLPDHYTFKVTYSEATDKWPEQWFVKILIGPDNESSYKTIGMLNPETGQFKLTRKSTLKDDSWPVRLLRRVFANIYDNTPQNIIEAGFDVHHAGQCGRCGRKLTTPDSIKTGLGPVCLRKSM